MGVEGTGIHTSRNGRCRKHASVPIIRFSGLMSRIYEPFRMRGMRPRAAFSIRFGPSASLIFRAHRDIEQFLRIDRSLAM